MQMEVKCSHFKSFNKGAVVGFADVVYKGIIFKDCPVFKSNDKSWFALPSKQYEVDGERKYQPYIMFESKDEFKQFQIEGLEAIRQYIREQMQPSI